MISSLQDCLHGIEEKSFGASSRSSRDSDRKKRDRRDRSRDRYCIKNIINKRLNKFLGTEIVTAIVATAILSVGGVEVASAVDLIMKTEGAIEQKKTARKFTQGSLEVTVLISASTYK